MCWPARQLPGRRSPASAIAVTCRRAVVAQALPALAEEGLGTLGAARASRDLLQPRLALLGLLALLGALALMGECEGPGARSGNAKLERRRHARLVPEPMQRQSCSWAVGWYASGLCWCAS